MTKSGAITAIIIWSAVALALIILLVFGVVVGTGNFSLRGQLRGELHEVFSREQDAAAINQIEISWHAGHVRVTPSADGQMRLKQSSYYDVDPIEYELSNGRVIIRQKNEFRFFFFGFGMRSSDLELSLPQKQYEEFALKMTSGETELDHVSATQLRLNMTSGELKANNLQAGTLITNVTSGQIEASAIKADSFKVDVTSGNVRFGGSFNAIDCGTTSGNVRIVSDTTPKSLIAQMTSGDVSVSIPDNEGFALTCKKTSGSLRSDFGLVSTLNGSKDDYTYGIGAASGRQYTIKITSGSFDLLKSAS